MPIEFACPSCKKPYRVKDELAGKSAKCGKCGNRMKIPVMPASNSPLKYSTGCTIAWMR
jgi:predicted Zn finger-like uncharacterized protein